MGGQFLIAAQRSGFGERPSRPTISPTYFTLCWANWNFLIPKERPNPAAVSKAQAHATMWSTNDSRHFGYFFCKYFLNST